MRRTILAALLLAAAAFAARATCTGPEATPGDIGPRAPGPQLSRLAAPAEPRAPAPGRAVRPMTRADVAADVSTDAQSDAGATTPPDGDAGLVDLRIRVLRADGSPASGAFVKCRPGGALSRAAFSAALSIQGRVPAASVVRREADGDGRIIERVLPRTVHVIDARLGEEIACVEHPVPDLDDDLEIRLQPGMIVSGAVRTVDGAPAAAASVRVALGPDGSLGSEFDTAGDDGGFVAGPFPRAATAPEVTVTAERADLLPARVVLAPGDPTRDVVVTLRPAVALRGRVIDDKGAPVALTWLLFHDGDYGDEQRILTDESGRFTARMVPTARGDMIFIVHEYVARRIQDALRVPGVRDLGDVVVRRGGTIRGTVVRPDGKPAERPHVGVLSLDLGVAICEARIGPGATFEGWRVGPGEHVLHVSDGAPPGVGGAWDPVEVRGCVAGTEGLRVVVTDGPGVLVRLHAAGDAADTAPRAIGEVGVTATRGSGDASNWRWMAGRGAVSSIRVPGRAGTEVDLEVTADGYETWRATNVRVPDGGTAAVVDAFLAPAAPAPR